MRHISLKKSMFHLIIVMSLLLLTVACESAPKHEAGRIDTSVTTDQELKSAKILPAALMEFSDQVPQDLAVDLAELPLVRDAEGRVTVIMGDINNKTGNVSSNEFELIRSRIRNTLLQSAYVRERIRFVESGGRMDELRARELGLAEGLRPALEPEQTYALNGDFYRIRRGRTNQYYMEFQLVHFMTNEIIFSKRYDVKQLKERR